MVDGLVSRPDVDVDTDALIVGAGPAGLYAAYYAGFRGRSAAVMDSLPEIGGQVAGLYPERLIYDVAGFPAVRGRDLISALAKQAARYGPRYVVGEEARFLDYPGGIPVVTTSSGLRVRAQFIVVTGGAPAPAPGSVAGASALESWGLTVSAGRLVVDTAMATNLDRVYAAGDITEYPGKVRLISVGFSEAATAVNNAVAALDPGAPLFPGHSSDLGPEGHEGGRVNASLT